MKKKTRNKMRQRKLLRCASARSWSYMKKSITLYIQNIPQEEFNALSVSDRYCFLLLGHIYNEISWLRRMSYIASMYELDSDNVKNSGNLMQVTFLARLLLGKLFEFKQVIEKNSNLRRFISDHFNPKDKAEGAAKIDSILAYYKKEEWIRTARNKHFLHYPNQSDVNELLNDAQFEWDVSVVHGKKSSNTLYPASDVMANYAWFKLANTDKPMQGFEEALKTILVLARETLSTLEQSIGFFIDEKLVSLSDNEEVTMRVSESIHDVRLNYFMNV